MKKNIIIILSIISFLQISSQDHITIEEAIQIGLKQNFDILITKQNYNISKLDNNWTQAGALPTINFSGNIGKNISDQRNNPTSFIQAMLKSDAINASINANWTIFNGFMIKANKEKLQNYEDLSYGNLTLVIENTIQAIILSYYNCIIQKKRVQLFEDIVNLSRTRLKYEKEKLNIGKSSKIEYLQKKSAMLTDSSNLIIQRMNYSNSVKNFNLLLSIESEKKWSFDDQIVHNMQVYNLKDLEEKTIRNNQNLINQYINIKISEQNIKLMKTQFYPMIGINAGATYNQSKYDLGNFEYNGSSTGKTLNYFSNLSLNLKIFDGGKIFQTINKIKLQKKRDELELSKLQQEVKAELKQYLNEYNHKIILYNLNNKTYEISKINYDLAIERYKNGLINSFILRDIELTYIRSGITFYETSYSLKQSEINLLKITGGIIEENQ